LAILFYDQDTSYSLSGRRKIKSWIKEVITIHQKKTGEINVIFTSDEYLKELNRQFLGRDYYTDVLTFDYSYNKIISGEIYVSIERVMENAGKFKNKFEEELFRVIIHGILHLLGYKDNTKKEERLMRKHEDLFIKMIK